MTAWDWIFGIAGLFGTIFAIYTYYKSEIAKTVETANNRIQQEKLGNLHIFLVATLNASDAIVQTSKRKDVTPEELGNMTRILRSQLYMIVKSTESATTRLNKWRFGRMIESQNADTENISEAANVGGNEEPDNRIDEQPHNS